MPIPNAVRSLFCLACVLAAPVHADPATPAGPETQTAPLPAGTLKALESLNTQTLLTEAQAQLATARASLAKARQSQGQEGSTTLAAQAFIPEGMLPAGLPNPAIRPPPPSGSLPRIQEISGQGRTLSARLLLDNHLSVMARTGSKIPGSDVIVTAISASAVEVKDAQGQSHTLTFGE
ncbi:type IV pilus biogenesis protein PilP [Sodalis endosymbiont of Spalangia cameroni]|uniref:type IV pilus biogenesis protein PilP n=1 Tax=Sodalis praecaptivus TaxID=1239307 RepID=UPI0031F8B3E7